MGEPTPVMPRPPPEIRRRNKALLELALPPDSPHWPSADNLMHVDNGSWSDTDGITHFCGGMFCCPGGIKDSKMKILAAILVP